MASLCRAKVLNWRKRRKGGHEEPVSLLSGRITGSASVDTLVKVGLAKEQGLKPEMRATVTRDFAPVSNEELAVHRGDKVHVLYEEHSWVYVINERKKEGFIPAAYCVLDSNKIGEEDDEYGFVPGNRLGPPGTTGKSSSAELERASSSSEASSKGHYSEIPAAARLGGQGAHPAARVFVRRPAGHYLVLYNFEGLNEDDVSVERGEYVLMLNQEDQDWSFVERANGCQGFVPSLYLNPSLEDDVNNTSFSSTLSCSSLYDPEDLIMNGIEMVALYDYQARSVDDLNVTRGDWLYADCSTPRTDGWLLAYSPRSRKIGFVPQNYTRPPTMTSL